MTARSTTCSLATELTAADVTASVVNAARLVDLAVEEPDIEEIVRRIYEHGT